MISAASILSSILNLARRPRPGVTRFFRPNISGIHVDEESALTSSAYFGCVRVVSEDISTFPWHVYRRDGENRERIDSRVGRILHVEANPEMSAFSARQTLLASALGWGNGYAEIERDAMGRAAALWPLHPARVSALRDDAGRLVWRVRNERAPDTLLADRDLFHVLGPSDDGVIGLSIARLARHAIGLGVAAEQFGSAFFGNGAHPGGVLSHPGVLKTQSRDAMRESWNAMHQGPSAGQRVAILEEGVKYTAIGVPPEDAQFLETRKFQVEDVARWFRVPPHRIGHLERATFNNIEQLGLDYLSGGILPWVLRLEQEANRKLISRPDVFTKLDFSGLLRADSKARAEFLTRLWGAGVLTANDILALEDRNTIGPAGDARFVPVNMQPLERALAPPPTPAPPPSDDPDPEPDDDRGAEDPDARASLDAFAALAGLAFSRLGRRQQHRLERGEASEDFWCQHGEYVAAELGATLAPIAAALGGEVDAAAIARDYIASAREAGAPPDGAAWARRALEAITREVSR